jgi:iron complex transport system substrate-binding protein
LKIILALLLLAALAGAPVRALEVTDDRGQVLRLARSPQRIVSLLPSLTESVCALGECARLVGVDRYSNHPASVRALHQVGGGLDPQIEAVLALKPDLVLMATSSRAGERLQALGVPVLAMEPKSHADVRRVLLTLGRVLDVADADAVWRRIDAAVSAAAQSLPARIRNTRVYFEVSRVPYGASASSFIGETLTRLGAGNILPAALGPFPRVSPEFVVRANPDLIMVGDRNMAGLTQRPGWAAIRAVREQRICVYPPEVSDVLVRAGPRMAEAARIMAQCLLEHAP